MSLADATPRYGHRDYSMLGEEARDAERRGLKSAEWYHTEISRKEMKELMKQIWQLLKSNQSEEL